MKPFRVEKISVLLVIVNKSTNYFAGLVTNGLGPQANHRPPVGTALIYEIGTYYKL